jgi:hypothetical protein
LLVRAIEEGTTSVFGTVSSRAMNMFLDPHIAVSNLDAYSASLERALGAVGKKLLIRAINQRFLALCGLEQREFPDLRDCVEYVRNTKK